MRRLTSVLAVPGLVLALLVGAAPAASAAPDVARMMHPPRCC
jgi:hypothetical protein